MEFKSDKRLRYLYLLFMWGSFLLCMILFTTLIVNYYQYCLFLIILAFIITFNLLRILRFEKIIYNDKKKIIEIYTHYNDDYKGKDFGICKSEYKIVKVNKIIKLISFTIVKGEFVLTKEMNDKKKGVFKTKSKGTKTVVVPRMIEKERELLGILEKELSNEE